jgi:hypothetical protein
MSTALMNPFLARMREAAAPPTACRKRSSIGRVYYREQDGQADLTVCAERAQLK